MKKMLYIALFNLNNEFCCGLKNKILNQVHSFQKYFDTFLFTQLDFYYFVLQNNTVKKKCMLLNIKEIYEQICKIIDELNISLIYIRYLGSDEWQIDFLRRINHKNIKIILEFPTIPYDAMKNPIELQEDKLYRKKLKTYVKMSTNFNDLDSVFNIPSFSINNGINIEENPLKKDIKHNFIQLIAVASMNYWHGYERIIEGLASYYRNTNNRLEVYLKLVGNGKEIEKYKALSKKYHIEKFITFVGEKFGDELTEEYDSADIAVGSLCTYKTNYSRASPLKTKEYCARGLPFVIAYKDLAFEDNLPFILEVPNNELEINIPEIINFYNNYITHSNKEKVRDYAIKNFTWDRIIAEIINHYKL